MDTQVEISDYEIFQEEDLPESTAQFDLVVYLVAVLEWLYRLEGWFIGGNLAVVYAPRLYIAPDIAVFKGVRLSQAERRKQKSYRVRLPQRPPPTVVFEISSADTWANDLNDKPGRYAQVGVEEYFVYDPNEPPLWKNSGVRLRGWRYPLAAGAPQEIQANSQGWLWSNALDSWLVPDGASLRLRDARLELRLTEAEAERFEYQALLEKLRKANIDPNKL